MATVLQKLPRVRPELFLGPQNDQGKFVLKNRQTGEYYLIGAVEHFLLSRCDGLHEPDAVRQEFESKFGEPLTHADLECFVGLAAEHHWLDRAAPAASPTVPGAPSSAAAAPTAAPPGPAPQESSRPVSRPLWQRLLVWRVRLLDPDRLFNRLEPWLRPLWTRTFLALSSFSIVAAIVLVWANRGEIVSEFANAFHWQTFLLVFVAVGSITLCHEFAHGLTCKRYGGEVHEVGFLMLYLMPCFYCNVSDAWLLPRKAQRLLVTLAGGYFEAFLWSLAVFAWRITVPDSALNFMAWVVVTVSGVRVLFNFNPLIPLDGYYLLGDWLAVPNLRPRAIRYLHAWLRALLWGAAAPPADPRRKLLLLYGLASWLFSLTIISVLIFSMYRYFGAQGGVVGATVVLGLGSLLMSGLVQGVFASDFTTMITRKLVRTLVWLAIVGGLASAAMLWKIDDCASGPFVIRPVAHVEIRAPMAGFIEEVFVSEGERVSPGAPIARLKVTELESRIAGGRAALAEAEAKARDLQAGARPEELAEAKHKVERLEALVDKARHDLDRAGESLTAELASLDAKIKQSSHEMEYYGGALKRWSNLSVKNAVTRDQVDEARAKFRIAESSLEETSAKKHSMEALGTMERESQLAAREKELGDARSEVVLLEAGCRPEELKAAIANRDKLAEELKYLEQLDQKRNIVASRPGTITTQRIHDLLGKYYPEGELICEIGDTSGLDIDVALAEQDGSRVELDAPVTFKARTLPFHTFDATVSKIAAIGFKGEKDTRTSVSVYCRVKDPTADLRPGTTGYARIHTGPRPLGVIIFYRMLRFVRTEFWSLW
ncbi:MAG TPA: efflux RND transporter periplasmic adaptor subunit [Pirellulales bacterium]|nr:efflux RND transporter periplasmic adaptor subunit [Pirellulales bacterium]